MPSEAPTTTTTVPTVDVLIVGAGPTGLALAVDLARRGTRALVVERGTALFPGSRGKGIQPRTQEVLYDLGVLDAARAAGGPYPRNMIWKDGRQLGEQSMFDTVEPTEAAPFTAPLMVAQWRTQEVLYERLRELAGEEASSPVAFERELTGLVQDADGVTAGFAAGPPVRARYVVAADGGRSAVRRLVGIGMTGETVDPDPILVADVQVSGLDRGHWHVFPPAEDAAAGTAGGSTAGGSTAGFLALCPLAGTADFQLTAQFPAGTAVDTSPDAVRKVVAARSHLTAEQVTGVGWASAFQPRMALADRFREGRVFLAGDAAHVHSPAGGQGLNTSVQDAYNLGWKLGAVLSGAAPESLLDTYEEERLPNAADVLGLSSSVHRGETRRGRATVQLGIGYRESSLTAETRPGLPPGSLHAGDRAPDGARGAVRLFDAFRGPHWTLLTVGTTTPVPDLPGVPVVRIPPYEAYGTGVFLVRPDGYVGWAGVTAEGVEGYAVRVGATRAAD
ncbi:Pentachlorophenol monooxygenase [Actinobacteria bacterium OK074]|nr:Pentachlorophenol monooxygenase [Actinobacteria bacterium OK074]